MFIPAVALFILLDEMDSGSSRRATAGLNKSMRCRVYPTNVVRHLNLAERVFAAFCVALAVIALAAFWPPTNGTVITWLAVWCGLCVLTAVAILRGARYASIPIWTLNALAWLSAVTAFRSGMLEGIGIVIDVVLFIPMTWFAVWYQMRRK